MKVGGLLIGFSAVLYLIQYMIFRTPRNIVYYFFQDLAFLPIEVLLVTIILHSLLTDREKRAKLRKLNMVIGAFFGETGTGLLELLAGFVSRPEEIGGNLLVNDSWRGRHFAEADGMLKRQNITLESTRGDLESLRRFLREKRMFLVRLLENPNLLEHDSFTDLLWAVFHLLDELDHRTELTGLPQQDYDHLFGDIQRAYTLLLIEWLAYMRHLKESYPYLFSLAVRTNPFNPDASVIFR